MIRYDAEWHKLFDEYYSFQAEVHENTDKFKMPACCDVCRNLEKCKKLDDKMRHNGTWKGWQHCTMSSCNRYWENTFNKHCVMRCACACNYNGNNHNKTYKFDGPMTEEEVKQAMAMIIIDAI